MKCPYCKKTAQKVSGRIIYPRRKDLHDRLFFYCAKCNAYVGTHKNSGEPMGTMADGYLRNCRHSTHVFLDRLWMPNTRARTKVYHGLARDMRLPVHKCHIAMFDDNQCKKAIEVLKTYTREMFNAPDEARRIKYEKITKKNRIRKPVSRHKRKLS